MEPIPSRRFATAAGTGMICVMLALMLPFTAINAQQPVDLTSLYEPGYLLQDTNGDSLPDRLDLHLVIPDAPNHAEVISVANLAARLGYETAAMDLDLLARPSELATPPERPVIYIGRAGIGDIGPGFAPGQGIIRFITPGADHPHGAIAVDGYDQSGLLAASNFLSARFPEIEGEDPGMLKHLTGRISKLAADDSLVIQDARLKALVRQAGRRGITRADVVVSMNDTASYRGLIRLLAKPDGNGESGKARMRWKEELLGGEIYRLDLIVTLEGNQKRLTLVSDRSQPLIDEAPPEAAGDLEFDLQDLYSINGLYRDTNKDQVPDDMSGYIAYSGSENADALVRLSARVGLETAGVRLPLVYPAGGETNPSKRGFPLLVGAGQQLADSNLIGSGEAGLGFIEFRKGKQDNENGIRIHGMDTEGEDAALDYLSGRVPYLWDYGKGNIKLDDVQTGVRRFFQGVGGPAQAAAGVEKLKTWLERMDGIDPETVAVELSGEQMPQGMDTYLGDLLKDRFPDARVQALSHETGFGVGDTVFTEDIRIPWEVDQFRSYFTNRLLPQIGPDARGMIRVRLSESREIRSKLREEILAKLEQKGVSEGAVRVEVINAYKQGFSWINEVVLPELRGSEVSDIHITYYNLRGSNEIRWQATDSETRWLQELYPVDGILTRELGIPDSAVTFSPTYNSDPVYRIEALDSAGDTLLSDTFNPKYAVRPYFDLFPKYDSVRVTTGWVEAEINGNRIADRRIITDLERFWDHLQTKTYRRIYDYVMNIQQGRPEPELAPYFDEFRLDVSLSEPAEQLGILKEQIAPLEALHEDIYFETLLFFRLIGNRYGTGPLRYPGRILPYIHPPAGGGPGRARVSFTGKKQARPFIKLTYRESGGEMMVKRYRLPNLPTEDPHLHGIAVPADREELHSLYFDIAVDKDRDPYPAFQQRGSERYIDRNFVSADRLGGMVAALREMQDRGLFEQALSYDRIGRLVFRFMLDDSTAYDRQATLARSEQPRNTTRKPLVDSDFRYNGQELVQWERPIPPSENHAILSRLHTFDTIDVYYQATSLLGHDVYAMDLLPPVDATYRSQAKYNALKPTLFISGRQHANEFSSTSHMLKLAEKVATDPAYGKYLRRVNLVLHPMTNPDGAELAVKLHQINPSHMHHAGYLGPLGVDITRDQRDRDPRYEVAKVRREIHDTWLPDIYINMHGYPPHEWVQYFAGYSAWMMDRDRGPGSNNYWIPRGYFLTGFDWHDHEDFPNNKELSFALLDSITTRVNAIPEMRRVNEEMQMRYRKYRSHEEAYGEFYRNGMWVNAPLRGEDDIGSDYGDPRVTYFTLTSEAPDEPAQGEWMRMNAEAGLAHSTAVLNYLYYGVNRIERTVEQQSDRVRRAKYRLKPVLPEALLDEGNE